MITVLGRRNSMNVQKVMWTLGELNLDYRREDAGGSFGYADDYAALNPNMTVPTIRDGDLVLWESGACVRYLARSYGADVLHPTDTTTLAVADQWMEWCAANLMAPLTQTFFNLVRVPADKANPAAIAAGAKRCGELYAMLDARLADVPFVAGEAFSMGDIPLGTVTYRYMHLDIDRPALPNVERWFAVLCDRPAYQKHAMIPFGRNVEEWNVEEQKNAGVQ